MMVAGLLGRQAAAGLVVRDAHLCCSSLRRDAIVVGGVRAWCSVLRCGGRRPPALRQLRVAGARCPLRLCRGTSLAFSEGLRRRLDDGGA